MISYLEGKIILKKEKFIVLNVNNVGYKVFLSKKTLLKLPGINDPLKVFCYLNVSENSLDLYGFLNQKEMEFFEIVKNIRGIGPKASLEISALGSLDEVKDRILKQDETLFGGIHGLGEKKTKTVILELTGIIKNTKKTANVNVSTDEAEEGLVNLGFARQQARIALSKVPKEIKETEQRIKEGLKLLTKI